MATRIGSAPSADKSGDVVTSATFTTVERPIESITPYERNPRHNADAVKAVAASIKEFGWRQPIVVDKHGVVIVGHTRLLAAKRLGLSSVPVHVADELTPAQVKALRIADNRVGENATWNDELLSIELNDLRLADFNLDLTGFEKAELDDLLHDYLVTGPSDADIERGTLLEHMEVTIEDPLQVVEHGQVWQLGEHVLVCCDPLREWPLYVTLLTDPERDILCPFPGPIVAVIPEARGKRLILVQPEAYIAGHIIDRYRDVNGPDSAVLQ